MTNVTNPVTVCFVDSTGQPVPVSAAAPLPTGSAYPAGSTALSAAATGTTGAVTASLAATSGKTNYIAGFNVSAIGGTAAVGPITVTNLIGDVTFTYHMASSASGNTLQVTFTPPIPAKAANTAIAVATTADGTASAVDVNVWGFQL